MPASPETLARVRTAVERYGRNATAFQLLNPGMGRHWTGSGALVGFGDGGRYSVVAGEPLCSASDLVAVADEIEIWGRARGRRIAYFAAEEPFVRALGPGADRLLLGAQPVWDPSRWSTILATKASLRYQLARARHKGVAVAAWTTSEATDHPELHRCLEAWLATRGLPPLHFLVEPDTLHRLAGRRIFVASRRGCIVGFLVASPIPARDGWLVEQIVRRPEAPNGTSELLLDAAWRTFAGEGAAIVTLGLAPLSRRAGLEPQRHFGLVTLLGVLRHLGRRAYDFEGLDAFKAKFLPDTWEPIWLVTSDHRIGVRTLWAVAEVFGQCSPLRLGARAARRAVGRS